MGDGFSGSRMPLIVGQLVVLDNGAVLVFSMGRPEVHGCLQIYRVYKAMSTIKLKIVCLHVLADRDFLSG